MKFQSWTTKSMRPKKSQSVNDYEVGGAEAHSSSRQGKAILNWDRRVHGSRAPALKYIPMTPSQRKRRMRKA